MLSFKKANITDWAYNQNPKCKVWDAREILRPFRICGAF